MGKNAVPSSGKRRVVERGDGVAAIDQVLDPTDIHPGVATNSAAAQESGSSRRSSLPGSQSSDRSKPPATSGPTSRSPTLREQSPVQTRATLHAGAAAVQNSEPISVMSTKDSAKYRRAVYRLQAIPAVDVARTLDQVFRAEGKVVLHDVSPMQVVIVPEVIGNNLIVSGPPEAIEEVGPTRRAAARRLPLEKTVQSPWCTEGAASGGGPTSDGGYLSRGLFGEYDVRVTAAGSQRSFTTHLEKGKPNEWTLTLD
jgi:hypothetical protein